LFFGFFPEDPVLCGVGGKWNPPNRLTGFYCGEPLDLPAEIADGIRFKPSEIEDWEPGVNIVVTGGLPAVDPQAIASSVAFDGDLASSLHTIHPPLPLFRLRPEDVGGVAGRLSRLGLGCVQGYDKLPVPCKPPTRAKGITF